MPSLSSVTYSSQAFRCNLTRRCLLNSLAVLFKSCTCCKCCRNEEQNRKLIDTAGHGAYILQTTNGNTQTEPFSLSMSVQHKNKSLVSPLSLQIVRRSIIQDTYVCMYVLFCGVYRDWYRQLSVTRYITNCQSSECYHSRVRVACT